MGILRGRSFGTHRVPVADRREQSGRRTRTAPNEVRQSSSSRQSLEGVEMPSRLPVQEWQALTSRQPKPARGIMERKNEKNEKRNTMSLVAVRELKDGELAMASGGRGGSVSTDKPGYTTSMIFGDQKLTVFASSECHGLVWSPK